MIPITEPFEPVDHRSKRRNRRPVRGIVAGVVAVVALGAIVLPAGAGRLHLFGVSSSPARDIAATTSAPATPETPAPDGPGLPSAVAQPPGSAPAKAPAGPAACGRKAGSEPVAKVTQINVGSPVRSYGGERDIEALPMAIAATPSGGSWLAWLGTDGTVRLGKLGCDDKLTGTPTAFAGIDLQDVQADANGGVLLLTRRGQCRTGPLCGGVNSPCNSMHMIRFDNNGKLVWDRQVTNLSSTRGGYDDGARFVWWYQHHGRLASDGTNYAAYYGAAFTERTGACVTVHQGDRMQVVNPAGEVLSGKGGFEVGCSHAWTSRIVWDPRTERYVTVCATDNDCRLAQPNPYRTVVAGVCDGTLFGGDLVLAEGTGYWTAWSQGGSVRVSHFAGNAPADRTIRTVARSLHPHLVRYGAGKMLLTWQFGTGMGAQVLDAGSGAPIGRPFTIGVRDHNYQAFKPYADGSTAYPAAGATNSSIRIARVMPS